MGETGDLGWVVGGEEVEDEDFVASFAKPGTGDVEGLLGAYVPEAADGVIVDPESAFSEVADVEEGVAGGGEGEVGAAKLGAICGTRAGEMGGKGGDWKAVRFPNGEGGAGEGDGLGDALGLDAHVTGGVDAAVVGDEDVEAGGAGGGDGEGGWIFEVVRISTVWISTVQGADEFAVEVDLGEVVEVGEGQVSGGGGGELGSVEDVAVALAEVLHGMWGVGLDWRGEVLPEAGGFGEGDGGDGDDGWGGWDGWEAGFISTRTEGGEEFAVGEEFGGGSSGLVEWGVVVVAGDVGEEVASDEAGACHKAEAGAAVKHVDVDSGSAVEDVVEVFQLGSDGACFVGVAPVIEPSWPVFGDEEGSVGSDFGEGVHAALVVSDAEVGGGVEAGDGAVGDVAPVVRGVEEGVVESIFFVDGFEVLHVGVVGAEVSVLVFDLGHEDGAASTDLEGSDFLGEAIDPAFCGDHEGGVVGAESSGGFGVGEEPGREATEIPLGTGVGAGAEDDVEAFLLGGLDEGDQIVVAGEVVVSGSGLVDVPEDIGGDGVEAHGAGHFETSVPVLAGDASVVELSGEDFEGFVVEGEVVCLDGEGVAGVGGRRGSLGVSFEWL